MTEATMTLESTRIDWKRLFFLVLGVALFFIKIGRASCRERV